MQHIEERSLGTVAIPQTLAVLPMSLSDEPGMDRLPLVPDILAK